MNSIRQTVTKINQRRCVTALIFCIAMVVAVFLGVTIKLVAPSTIDDPDEGVRAFRYFTVLSGMVVAACAFLCIPYTIEGLKSRNYHLPRWIVDVLFLGVTGVTLTFLIALCFLAPATSFQMIFLEKANFFLHTICPVLSILLFLFINDDHNIKKNRILLAILPTVIYAAVYFIEVIVIGEENGGWRDHYMFTKMFPIWVPLVGMPLIVTLIASGLRYIHNKRHEKRKKQTEELYMNSVEFSLPSLEEAITAIAKEDQKLDKGGELIVPRRVLKLLQKKYQTDVSLEDLSYLYARAYLNHDN